MSWFKTKKEEEEEQEEEEEEEEEEEVNRCLSVMPVWSQTSKV